MAASCKDYFCVFEPIDFVCYFCANRRLGRIKLQQSKLGEIHCRVSGRDVAGTLLLQYASTAKVLSAHYTALHYKATKYQKYDNKKYCVNLMIAREAYLHASSIKIISTG